MTDRNHAREAALALWRSWWERDDLTPTDRIESIAALLLEWYAQGVEWRPAMMTTMEPNSPVWGRTQYDKGYAAGVIADRTARDHHAAEIRTQIRGRCQRERLTEEGQCRSCGEDRRGA